MTRPARSKASPPPQQGAAVDIAELLKHESEVVDFRHTLNAETDRGVALMAAAFIEYQLESLLRTYFVDERSVVNRLFEADGPLGTLSAKTDASYVLGLIPKETRRDIHLIRKIRNEFAHSSAPMTFETPGIANRCALLGHDFIGGTKTARQKFVRTAIGVLAPIRGVGADTAHRSVPPLAVPGPDVLKRQAEFIQEAHHFIASRVGRSPKVK